MTARRRHDERGAATMLALTLLGALVSVAVALAPLGGALVASRRAAAAADLAALAGASALQQGRDACAAAARVAAANDARVAACAVRADDVRLRVVVDAGRVLGRSLEVSGRARAGPS
jgi:secretion/DNA translocation related TadE-like protein